MNDRQPGLIMRLEIEARHIASQHEKLGLLYGAFVSSLESDGLQEAGAAFDRFAAALRAHMDLEERIHIPALLGSDEELQRKLRRIVDEHDVLRRDLEVIATGIASGRLLDAAGQELADFATRLIEHERFEESLFPRNGR